jgi:hypothetical protein
MSPEQARIALIDSIYEAVLDNDRWPSVLESIADAIGTVQVAVASIDQQANIVAVIAPRIDPELVASWRDYWAFRDPFFARANPVLQGKFIPWTISSPGRSSPPLQYSAQCGGLPTVALLRRRWPQGCRKALWHNRRNSQNASRTHL